MDHCRTAGVQTHAIFGWQVQSMFSHPPRQRVGRCDLRRTVPGRLTRQIMPLPRPRRRVVYEEEVTLPPVEALVMEQSSRAHDVIRLDVSMKKVAPGFLSWTS
eukprot:2252952-Amphidinium_carterae.1